VVEVGFIGCRERGNMTKYQDLPKNSLTGTQEQFIFGIYIEFLEGTWIMNLALHFSFV